MVREHCDARGTSSILWGSLANKLGIKYLEFGGRSDVGRHTGHWVYCMKCREGDYVNIGLRLNVSVVWIHWDTLGLDVRHQSFCGGGCLWPSTGLE